MIFLISHSSYAQKSAAKKTATYDILYDEPYDVNKLFIHLLPVYGELYSTNVNIGWGIKADYYHHDKFDASFHFRKPYGQRSDFMRDVAEKNSNVSNTPYQFYFMELGGTYHIIDKEEDTESKFVLYSKNYSRDNKWETMVPEFIIAPTKQRRIYGARLGGMNYQTTFDMNRVLEDQGNSLVDSSGVPLATQASIYGNMSSAGLYIGGSISMIKNVTVAFDKTYNNVANDLLFTAFIDMMYFPSINVEDVNYRADKDSTEVVYSSDVIETNPIGFRLGMEGKFNREFSWGYGAELGYRPGIKGNGIFVMVRFSFPIFGTKLEHQVEALRK